MMSNFWQHCAISALDISKKHFAMFDLFVKIKLVSHKRPFFLVLQSSHLKLLLLNKFWSERRDFN